MQHPTEQGCSGRRHREQPYVPVAGTRCLTAAYETRDSGAATDEPPAPGTRIAPAIGTQARYRTHRGSFGANGVSKPIPELLVGCASSTPVGGPGASAPTSFVSRLTEIGLGGRPHDSRYLVVLGYTRRNGTSDANVTFLAERSTHIGFLDEAADAGREGNPCGRGVTRRRARRSIGTPQSALVPKRLLW